MTNDLAISNSIPFVAIEKVNDLANRLAEFLPGARDLPKEARLTLAQIGLMHSLDPFTGEIWAIPQKERETGRIVGFSIMVGIAGWRASAHRSGEYWGRTFRECTPEERAALGAGPKDLALRCIVMRRRTGSHPVEFDGYGIYRQGERTKMNPLQCVRYRAERDAMKAAFPISLNVAGAKVNIVDDNGEIINGDVRHGPDWDALSRYDDDTQQHQPIDAEMAQAPGAPDEPENPVPSSTEATTTTAEPSHTPAPQPRKPASIAPSIVKRWKEIVTALAAEIPYYRYDNGEPNLYRVVLSAGQMGYADINESNFAAVLKDLKQHAIEQTADVPLEV